VCVAWWRNGQGVRLATQRSRVRLPALRFHVKTLGKLFTQLTYRSTLTAVGRSQLLARWPGTHSRIISGIQRAAQTVFGVCLKRTCSRVTSASSALKVLNDYALYKSTHSLRGERGGGQMPYINCSPPPLSQY